MVDEVLVKTVFSRGAPFFKLQRSLVTPLGCFEGESRLPFFWV
jgi:hypothetical protein